jgi:hypothetical protein
LYEVLLIVQQSLASSPRPNFARQCGIFSHWRKKAGNLPQLTRHQSLLISFQHSILVTYGFAAVIAEFSPFDASILTPLIDEGMAFIL